MERSSSWLEALTSGLAPASKIISIVPTETRQRHSKMADIKARVKSVFSGDTVVLTSTVEGSTAERTLSLAYVSAPRLNRDGDEPYAFQSRQFLLQALVGKVVSFRVLYEIPTTKRQYGILYIDDVKYPQECVRNGWATVRETAGRKDDSEATLEFIEELRALEAAAKAEGLGIWGPGKGTIEVQNDIGSPDAFLAKYKNQVVKAQVERAITGDRLLVRLFDSDNKHYQVMTLIAGIKAPSTQRTNQETQQVIPAEPFANEARLFVESRLLQRQVEIKIVGLSPQNQIIGIVQHPKGDIGVLVVGAGFARPFDSHAVMVGPYMAKIRAAETFAQEKKNGMWKGHVFKVNNKSAQTVQVVRVFSADTVFIRSGASGEKRISISSIRGPRGNEPSEAPFRDAAKEFLRKKLIGKQVKMIVDGIKAANGDYEEQEVATFISNETNINLLLVQEGWASVIRHRRDDTDRAQNWDELIAAQEVAKEQKRGMWSPKPPAQKTLVDASETLQKAKMNLGSLQRQRKIPAIVDYVKSGSRFTVLVPTEGVKLNFVLGGIRAPKSARNATEQGEPFGQEAHEFASRHLNQRDVEINVHNIDKVGGFIGEIFVNRVSFAKLLVEEGLATVHQYSAEQSGNAGELIPAEDRAKQARKNLWKDWDPSQDEQEESSASGAAWGASSGAETAAPTSVRKDLREVTVTNVDDEGRLKIQQVGAGTTALESLITQFRSFHLLPNNNVGLPADPKIGDFVSAKSSEDGKWYRARVRGNDRAAKVAEVQFIDFGNKEKIEWSKLRPLAAQFNAQKLKGQAEDAALTLVQFPSTNKEYMADAVHLIEDLALGKKLVANFDAVDRDGVNQVTLYLSPAGEKRDIVDTVNIQLIGEGCAMVPKKLKAWESSYTTMLQEAKDAETYAYKNRLGMWEYGDLTED